MNLDHIRYFQAIAYYEHYGRAAQALHVEPAKLELRRHPAGKRAGRTPV